MGKKRNIFLSIFREREQGQTLVLCLVLLLLGTLIITPLLNYIATGIKTGQVFQGKTDELYAADAGIEDGIWQIKYDNLNTLFSSYNVYDYNSTWTYNLIDQVNGYNPAVSIDNIWIPKDLTTPTVTQASSIISTGKLIITGNVPSANTYQIKIYYYMDSTDNPLKVESVGIWLPAGFDYILGSSNFENATSDYYSVPVVSSYAGGQAIVWTFSSYPFAGNSVFDPFPSVNPLDNPMTSIITFQYNSANPGRNPEGISWITTSDVPDIPFSWDADTVVCRINSVAGDTEIEAYTAKSEIRELGSAIAGDYRAIGNSLMIDQIPDAGGPRRDTLLAESSATVSDIPSDAEVEAAYLYWSAWLAGGSNEVIIWQDDCQDFSDWNNPANDWSISFYRFRGRHLGSAPDANRYLSFQKSLDLSSYQGQTVMVSWDQSEISTMESTDGLDFGFSADGGSTWSANIEAFRDDNPPSSFSYVIPDIYLTEDFMMRFYLVDCASEYIYIDNIKISAFIGTIADTTAIFKIDNQQVYFDSTGIPQQGAQEINATDWSVLENKIGTYSYSCYLDVTELVKAFTVAGPYGNHSGNADYTVGDVDADTGDEWSYAGWSLLIIYSSPETRGHQLYLYDNFIYSDVNQNVDFDGDGSPGGTISGFLVPDQVAGETEAAKITVFVGEGDDYYNGDYLKVNGIALSDGITATDVWNSWSQGMSEDGVDIDTFYITWISNLLIPGDTMAQIDLPTSIDSWNLVYIIISFRSESTAGGAISYLIRG